MLVEHLAQLAPVELDDRRAAGPAADEVDQDVDPPESPGHRRGHRPGFGRPEQVARGRHPAIIGQAQLAGLVLQPADPGAGQPDPRTGLGETGHDNVAEDASRAGHEDDPLTDPGRPVARPAGRIGHWATPAEPGAARPVR